MAWCPTLVYFFHENYFVPQYISHSRMKRDMQTSYGRANKGHPSQGPRDYVEAKSTHTKLRSLSGPPKNGHVLSAAVVVRDLRAEIPFFMCPKPRKVGHFMYNHTAKSKMHLKYHVHFVGFCDVDKDNYYIIFIHVKLATGKQS